MRYQKLVKTNGSETARYNYVYADGQLILLSYTSGSTTQNAKFIYDSAGEVRGFVVDGVTEYLYVKNPQGDIVAVISETGVPVVRYTYDAWGNATISADSGYENLVNLSPFAYRGYCYDNDIKMYYLQSRYYDPQICRFINADSSEYLGATGTVLSCNLFAYCENDPVNKVDPKGTVAANIVGAVIGAIIGVVGGTFLGNWLADRLGLSGKPRTTFVVGVSALVGASVATIGYFIGPYVAKIGIKLGRYIANLIQKGKIAIKNFSSNAKSSLRALLKESCCFVAGTIIDTPQGQVPIEHISVGDNVFAINPDTGELGIKKVTNVFRKETTTLYHIVTTEEELITTETHPFWVVGKGWVNAQELNIGDLLHLQNGETMEVSEIIIEKLNEPIWVYNFEVEDWHNYFVGKNKILVHNANCNLNKISNSFLKKNKLDAHQIKREILGKKANISLYDLYYDKSTKAIFILKKGAKAASSIATGYFLD